MMKVIQVTNCDDCPFCRSRRINMAHDAHAEMYCGRTNRVLFKYTSQRGKAAGFDAMGGQPPSWCPLKDVSEH